MAWSRASCESPPWRSITSLSSQTPGGDMDAFLGAPVRENADAYVGEEPLFSGWGPVSWTDKESQEKSIHSH